MEIAGKFGGCLNIFILRCQTILEDEQAKILPDNNLIAVLCDAVRIVREIPVIKTEE